MILFCCSAVFALMSEEKSLVNVVEINALFMVDMVQFTAVGCLMLQMEGDFFPDLKKDKKGANWFDRYTHIKWLVIGGGDPVDIKTSPMVVVKFGVPAQTVDEFYGERIVQNMADFFDIPPSKIKVVVGSNEKEVEELERKRKKSRKRPMKNRRKRAEDTIEVSTKLLFISAAISAHVCQSTHI